MKNLPWLGIALAIVVVGCNPSATSGGTAKTDTKSDPPKSTEPASTPKAADPTSSQATPTEPPKPEDIAANVKTDAYRYLGLNQKASPKFELTGSPGGIQTGSVETTLVSVENGIPRFKQTWTGGLSYIGESELIAKPDGVYSVSAGGKQLDPPQMELPAVPAKDVTWSANNKFELQGATIEKSQIRVLGPQSVKTKLGTFSALAVRAMVTGQREGKALKVTMTAHYVKDRGPVRIEIQGPGADGKPTVTVLQATK